MALRRCDGRGGCGHDRSGVATAARTVGAAACRPAACGWGRRCVGVQRLGLMVLLVIPYTYLLVSAALPWERAWARWAVPGIVVAGCSALAATASATLLVRVLLAAPFAIGVLALFREMARVRAGEREIRRQRDRRRFGYKDATPSSVGSPGSAGGRGGGHAAGARRHRRHRPRAVGPGPRGSIPDHGHLGRRRLRDRSSPGGLGVVVAAMFFALAQGLRRRYDEFRAVFVVMQVVVGVLLLLTRGGSWTGPGVAWAFGTAALAMFVRVRPAAAA